jgi:hypothetical protein
VLHRAHKTMESYLQAATTDCVTLWQLNTSVKGTKRTLSYFTSWIDIERLYNLISFFYLIKCINISSKDMTLKCKIGATVQRFVMEEKFCCLALEMDVSWAKRLFQFNKEKWKWPLGWSIFHLRNNSTKSVLPYRPGSCLLRKESQFSVLTYLLL